MKKINFINNEQPALNNTNLNSMQNNIEEAIDGIVVYENSNGISSGTITLSSSISDAKKIAIVFEEENKVEGYREVENPIREKS